MIFAPLLFTPLKSVGAPSVSEATDSPLIMVVFAAATSASKSMPAKSKLSGAPVQRTK